MPNVKKTSVKTGHNSSKRTSPKAVPFSELSLQVKHLQTLPPRLRKTNLNVPLLGYKTYGFNFLKRKITLKNSKSCHFLKARLSCLSLQRIRNERWTQSPPPPTLKFCTKSKR